MPRFTENLKKWVRGDSLTPVASAARTANGDSGWLNSEEFVALILKLDVTAASGTTPTLDVHIDTAEDSSGTNNRLVASFAQKTGVSAERKSFAGLDKYYRVRWVVGGTTPNFTFSVAGESK